MDKTFLNENGTLIWGDSKTVNAFKNFLPNLVKKPKNSSCKL